MTDPDPDPGAVVFGRVEAPGKVLARAHRRERGCFQTVADAVY